MVTLVAVSKSQPAEAVRAAYDAGCRDFGESYAQEALTKIAQLQALAATWHYIGHLQSNKARDVAAAFDWVHGVDRAKIAHALGASRPPNRRDLNVCIQVNISAEASKRGVAPGDALALAREVAGVPRLKLRGVMGMARPTDDVKEQREQFATLRGVFARLRANAVDIDTLSMGMSDDFEAAIAEGATMVRIGTLVFGSRADKKHGSEPNVVKHRGTSNDHAHELGSDPKHESGSDSI